MSKAPTTQVIETTEPAPLAPLTRIVIVNFSGNTGKTTLARHLLMPAMAPGAQLIRVESTNSSGGSIAHMEVSGEEFESVAQELFDANNDIVVDIGASNVEFVRAALRRLGLVHNDVELWLIPCVPGSPKMGRDTVATIDELLSVGVDPRKICVVKNKVLDVKNMNFEFAALIAFANSRGVPVVNAPVLQFDLYPGLDNVVGETIDSLVADKTDYRTLNRQLKAQGKVEESAIAVESEFKRRNATSAIANLNEVRAGVFACIAASQAA